MTAIAELTRIARNVTNDYLDDWKKNGKKVVGFTCSYVPEEILHAAGLLPYRLKAIGSKGTTKADVYMPKFHCGFSKALLDQALSGAFSFLDGVVFVNSCDQLRRMYDVWNKLVSFPFQTILVVPHSYEDEEFNWYFEHEVKKLQRDLEDRFGARITDESLADSINVYNETRMLLSELHELRTLPEPKITGAEAHRLAIAATSMPKQDYNRLLRAALRELRERSGIARSTFRARVLVGGSMVDEPELLEAIENVGGLVVSDVLCTGARWYKNRVDASAGDALYAVAKRYYEHHPCPRMVTAYKEKRDFLLDEAKESKVDGAIFSAIAFCDHHSGDNVLFSEDLAGEGIPSLRLERDNRITDIGRLKTRIEAFFEKIGR